MVDLSGVIPLTLGGIVGLVVEVAIITAILTLSDKFIAHEMAIKHSLLMAFVAYLVVPVILAFASFSIPFVGYIVPLVVWLVLGEVLLKGDRQARLKASLLAFVVYIVLTSFVNIPGIISGLL